jgi:hypothetical protein
VIGDPGPRSPVTEPAMLVAVRSTVLLKISPTIAGSSTVTA